MADTAETVLQTFLSNKFDSTTRWDLKNKRLHRLVASFIYLRAKALTSRQGLSTAAAATEITSEITQVKGVVTDRLGANNRSGALGGPQDAGTPSHLDLADVAKQRTTDLGSVTPGRAKEIQKTQQDYVLDRRRCVLAILWRAAALEFQLWEDSTKNLKPLDVIGLKNVLDRRLRAVERLHAQVGATDDALTLASVATHNSGWLDGMRVRIFEYPNFTLAASQFPTVQPDTPAIWVPAVTPGPNNTLPVTIGYAVRPPPATRQYNGSTTDTQTVATTVSWRFPASQQSSWLVSAGKNRGYRIDLVPATGTTAAALIDSLFSYQVTVGGAPEKADVWNRAWLLCDHVVSAIHLESVLFGLRRLATATNQPLASADDAFNALVALRPTLTVHRFDNQRNPLPQTGTVISPFVSLDAHLHDHGVVAESYQPDPKVLIESQEPDGTTFADPYFRNLIGGANDLQIGDRVAIFSNPVYDSISNSVWGLENSLVVDIDPDSNNPTNRGGLKINELQLEGHGLQRAKYPNFRTSLGKGLTDAIEALKSTVFTTTNRPVHPHNEAYLVEWAPYDDFTTIKVDLKKPEDKDENIQQVGTGPWWVALSVRDFILNPTDNPDDVTPEQALAQVPGAIGRPDVTRYNLRGDPTVNNDNARALLGLGAFSLFDKYILFPLVEPRVKSQKSKAAAGTPPTSGLTWSDLFFFHSLNIQNLGDVTFRMLVADQKVIPGFALTRDPLDPLDHVPMIQPRPRRVP